MAERKINDKKLVAWFMAAKNVIKFANDDTTYKLAEAVIKASNFDKFPLSKGDKVEVAITDGVVTYLRKQKSETKGQGSEEAYEPTASEEAGTVEPEKPKAPAPAPKVVEPVKESAPTGPGSQELTVFAVAANRKVVKFLEIKDSGWYQVSEELQKQDYVTIGLIAKSKVMVLLNDKTVVSCARIVSEPAEQPKTTTSSPANAKVEPTAAPAAQAPVQAPKKEWRPYSSNDNDGRQLSIEAQSSINAACDVVGRVAAALPQAPTANVINSMVKAVAEANHQLLQELKKKKYDN